MNTFNFKKRNLRSGPHFIGILIILAGLFALVSPVFFGNQTSIERIIGVGAGAVVLGLLMVFSYSGVVIDLAEKRYKPYFAIAGFKTGEWTTLPNFIRVKVISTSKLQTNIVNGISPTLSRTVTDFKLQLYSNASKPVHSFIYSKKEKAVKDAKLLASKFNAELTLVISENG